MDDFALLEIIICLFMCFCFFGVIRPMLKKHGEATNGIMNHDPARTKFVYKIKLSSQQIIDRLNIKGDPEELYCLDDLGCTFDFDHSIIRFSEYGGYLDFYYSILECGDYSVLRLKQVSPNSFTGSDILWKLNPFLADRLQAEIVPFSQYSF